MSSRSSPISRVFALILAGFPFSSCAAPIIGNGKIEIERRELPAFRSLSFSGSGTLHLRRGPQSLSVSVDSNLLPYVETRVSGGKLYVGIKPGAMILNSKNLVVEASIPELEGIELSGSGDVRVERFEGDSLRISVSGSGKLDADIDYRELDVSMFGSGFCAIAGSADRAKYSSSGSSELDADLRYRELELSGSGSSSFAFSGSAERAVISLSGSCRLEAADLKLESASLEIQGSGDAKLRVSKRLDISVSGSGKVGYYGRPAVSQKVSGSGKVTSLGN